MNFADRFEELEAAELAAAAVAERLVEAMFPPGWTSPLFTVEAMALKRIYDAAAAKCEVLRREVESPSLVEAA